MSRLIWGDPDAKWYESGLDHGVLYPESGPGVVWNGLISVDETVSTQDPEELFFDGIKYLNFVSSREFSANLKALSAPREFDRCLGTVEVVPGFSLTRQGRQSFGFAYRTMINESDYRLTMVYNATATTKARGTNTLNDKADPQEFQWDIDAVPPTSNTFRPTARFMVDSAVANPTQLGLLEDVLYGTDVTDPALPTVAVLIALFND